MANDEDFQKNIKERIRLRKGPCRVSVAQTKMEFEKKRLTRENDVIEHRYRR